MSDQVNETATFTSEQINMICESVRTVDKANAEAQAANEKRMGAYGTFTQLASEMDSESFEQSMDNLFASIRVNTKGIAKRVKAKANDKGDGWKIPSSMSSAKSVLLSAYEYGVPLLDEETDAPRPFGTIRKEAKAAKQAEEQAERTLQEIQRDMLVDRLTEFAASLKSEEPDLAMAGHYADLETALDDWTLEHAKLSGADEDEVEALEEVLKADAA